jgi:hypothetical protein
MPQYAVKGVAWRRAMKKTVPVLFAITVSLLPAMADGVMSLSGSEWGLGDDGTNGVVVTFASDGRVSGSLGCNRFTGRYTQNGFALEFGPLAGTRMACSEEKMKTEQMLNEVFAATKQADISHLKLVLQDATGKPLVTLQRRDFD